MDTTVHRGYQIPKADNTDTMDASLWRLGMIAVDNDMDAIIGVWTSYVPAVTAGTNPTHLGVTGKYKDNGGTVDVVVDIEYNNTGGASTPGVGTWNISLPVNVVAGAVFLGTGLVSSDGTSNTTYPATVYISSINGQVMEVYTPHLQGDARASLMGGAGPAGVAWASGGFVRLQARYQKA